MDTTRKATKPHRSVDQKPEPIQPCTATGPSCTDANQLILGVPIPLLSLVAFTLTASLSALSLKDPRP